MAEKDVQRRMDPEALAKQSAEHAPSLAELFCRCLEGKVALVTGGASGLGYAVVNRLCEAGAKVVIASRGEERGKKAVADFREKGYEVSWVKTDVSVVADCYRAVDFAVSTYGKVDILVSNAAGWSSCSYLDVSEELYDRILDVDLKGSYFMGQAAARHMVANKIKGKIVFISSAAHLGEGQSNLVMNTYYQAAKAGVTGLTRGAAEELKQYGISVNCVAPGGMLSAGVFTQGTEYPAKYGEAYQEARKKPAPETPLAMNPDEVGRVVFALCTPMADFMCGEVVNVNGGAMLKFQTMPLSYTVEGCIPGPQKESC
ncbi:MAG: SDR family oxidoreductase [Eubacteriales bacterium]|nr:SDR family oxidoreductase [Eubacteriales bacterium]